MIKAIESAIERCTMSKAIEKGIGYVVVLCIAYYVISQFSVKYDAMGGGHLFYKNRPCRK